MINLVMIGPYPQNPAKIQRGVEAVTVYLVEGLKCIPDLTVQIISCTPTVDKEVTHDVDGIAVHFVPATRRFGNVTFGAFERYRIRRKIKELSPDIIHNQYHFAYPYIESKPICPTITSIHGITYKEAPYENERLDWLRRLPRLYLERVVLKRIEHAICVTEYVRRTMAHMTKANLYVVENPVHKAYFQVNRNEVPGTILFVGTIIKRKNILDLLKAIALLKNKMDVKLRIVGTTEEPYYYKILLDYIRDQQLDECVSFLGNLPEEKVLEEYGKCSVVALTSFEESSGMVLQQAMAVGRPVVATGIGGIPCIVRDNVTGFLTKLGDVNALAEKIGILLGDRKLRAAMGQEGRREACARFRPSFIGKMTFEVYRKVLEEQDGDTEG